MAGTGNRLKGVGGANLLVKEDAAPLGLGEVGQLHTRTRATSSATASIIVITITITSTSTIVIIIIIIPALVDGGGWLLAFSRVGLWYGLRHSSASHSFTSWPW
jgi:hypothetical protein